MEQIMKLPVDTGEVVLSEDYKYLRVLHQTSRCLYKWTCCQSKNNLKVTQ